MKRISFVDSHTGGEPTRVILDGGPDLGGGPLAERLALFKQTADSFRRATITEPRGSDVIVGALLTAPVRADSAAAVLFYDNATYLGMCGHGTIGVVATLAHLGRIGPGTHAIETPVGTVRATLHGDGSVTLANVASRRRAARVRVEVPGHGPVTGDVAWGGNWFFLTRSHPAPLTRENADALGAHAWAVRAAVNAAGFPEVDHIVLLGAAAQAGASARNFVLCPGKAYDRSPCGTGTSAWLACLAADGMLEEGAPYVVESILGSRFTGRYQWESRAEGSIFPEITGAAHVMAEGTLLFHPEDPFGDGVPE